MRTFLPPREKSGASSDNDNSAGGNTHLDSVEYLELCVRKYPEAKRRALLSVVPGVGQYRNGEYGKGNLFMAVTLVNLAVVASVIASGPVTACLTNIAAALHRQPNFALATPLQQGVIESPALFIYMGLVALFVWYAVRDAYDRAVQIIREGEQPPKYALTLPESTSGSYLAHFAVMASFVLLVIFFITPQPPKPQVTVIELVQPVKPQPEPKKPAPKRQQPRPKAEKPKPVVEPPKPIVKPQVVKRQVQPPKPVPIPVAVATPTNEPTPFTTAPAAAPPAADPAPAATAPSGGSGTGTGTSSGDGGNGQEVDMGPYMKELQRKIKKAWFPPKGNESKRVKVSFKLHKNGSVTKVKLLNSSGVQIADDAATQAVGDAAPFAPLPDGVGDEVDINFTFDYNVFGSRK